MGNNKKSYCRPRKENRRYEEKQKMHFGAGFILATLAALTVGAKLPSAGLSKRAKTDPRTFFAILGRENYHEQPCGRTLIECGAEMLGIKSDLQVLEILGELQGDWGAERDDTARAIALDELITSP